MSDEIVFRHNPGSRSKMVRSMVGASTAPHRTVLIDFEKNEHKAVILHISRRTARPAFQRAMAG